MDRNSIPAALLFALMLGACDRTRDSQEAAPPAPNASQGAETRTDGKPPPADAPATGTDGTDDGRPDLTPPVLTPEADRSVEGARNVLLSFARAIEHKEYGQAWALLSPADKQKWSEAQFAALFADLDGTIVAVPTGTMEGAAGSIYYTAPVTITATDKDGRPVRIEGEAILRRVNDIDGATPAQLRWHFETLTLDWTH